MFLSRNTPDSMLGNLLADFIKGNGEDKFPEEIVKGIRNHREVDLFTDSNNVVTLSRKLISTSRDRFSSIIIDVVYDHFLSRNWDRYSNAGLDEFIGTVYENLSTRTVRIPQDAVFVIEKMTNEDWLRSYGTMEGMDKAFKRISKKLKRENNLSTAVEELELHYSDLNAHFLRFFPELITHLQKR